MACFWFDKYKTYLVTLPLAMVGHFEVALFVFELQIPEVHLAPKVSRHNSLNKRFYVFICVSISLFQVVTRVSESAGIINVFGFPVNQVTQIIELIQVMQVMHVMQVIGST